VRHAAVLVDSVRQQTYEAVFVFYAGGNFIARGALRFCPVFGVTLAVEDDSGFVKEGVVEKTLVFAIERGTPEIVELR